MSSFTEKYFSWFFKTKTPIQLHTKFVSSTVFIAEIHSQADRDYINQLFFDLFDFEHYDVLLSKSSLLAFFSQNGCFARMTYGKTEHSDIILITFKDIEESVVSPIIRVFAQNLEDNGLLKDMELKQPKEVKKLLCKQIGQYAYEKYITVNEEEKHVHYILSQKDVKKSIEIVSKYLKEKGYKGKKNENDLIFEKEKEKITVQIGKNAEKETIMNLGFDGLENWKELGLNLGKVFVQNEVLFIFGEI